MSQTKPSERLRELRENLRATIQLSEWAEDLLEKSIAQAEAMEKLAFFEARVKPSSDDPEAEEYISLPTDAEMDRALEVMPDYNKRLAQAGELSDEFVKARAMEIYPPDEVNDGHPWYGHRRAIEDTAARHMVRHLHKCGYLHPLRTIGEQTPAAEEPYVWQAEAGLSALRGE